MNKIVTATPKQTEITDASGPNDPPVIISDPFIDEVKMVVSSTDPETGVPNTFPSKKFHAQCMPIGNSNDPLYIYAAPNINPASIAIANDDQMVALSFVICIHPNKRAEMTRAMAKFHLSLMNLKIIPRKTISSPTPTSRKKNSLKMMFFVSNCTESIL